MVSPVHPFEHNEDYNFWYVVNDSEAVFVFVHGIFSNARTCWWNADANVFWPDLVAQDPRLDHPSIYLAGYYTALDAGDYPVRQCADAVFQGLKLRDPALRNPVLSKRRIIFICHSTGGIVVRDLLIRYRDAFADKEVGLLLYASPSLGSDWASLASALARLQNQTLGGQLTWRGTTLDALHHDFKDLVDQRRIARLLGAEAAENKMILRENLPRWLRVFLPNRWKVVGNYSAGQYFGAVTTLADTDHFGTVKPDDLYHPAHTFLVEFWERVKAAWELPPAVTPVAVPPLAFPDAALAIAQEIRSAFPDRTAQPIAMLRPFISKLFQRRSFELTREDSLSRLLYTLLATHQVWDDEIVRRCEAPGITEIRTAIYEFEDVLARALEIGGARIDGVRATLPDKEAWLANHRDPDVTLALRSKKRDFLLRVATGLQALGCFAPRVPRLDAAFLPSPRTGTVKRSSDNHYNLRVAIVDRPAFVTKARYDVRHESFPPAWTITFDEDPNLADDEMRSKGDVAVKVTLYADDGTPFVEFTEWLSAALDAHYGPGASPDVQEALAVLRSR